MTPPVRPRISVLLPVRDGAATVGAALQSLASQTFANFEVIVVDDGSRDRTARVVREWAARDGRVRTWRTPRAGLVKALQHGLARVRAPIVARMDADDSCHPERLRAQLDFLERSGLAGCGTGVRIVPEDRVTERAAEYAAWLNSMTDWLAVAANLFVECPLAHPTFMFRTEVLMSAGGYRDRGWPEDYDLLLRIARAGHRFAALPRTLLNWRDSQGRLSRNHPSYSLDAFRTCKVHHLRRSPLARSREGVVVWGAGPTGKRLALEFQRQGVSVGGFIDVDQRKIGQVIHGAKVLDTGAARQVRNVLHVGAVARAKGRAAVRRAAAQAGLRDGADFVSMA